MEHCSMDSAVKSLVMEEDDGSSNESKCNKERTKTLADVPNVMKQNEGSVENFNLVSAACSSASSSRNESSNEESCQNGDAEREFDVLDEVMDDAQDDNNKESSYDSSESESDCDVPEEEIEAMLEEGLPDELKDRAAQKKDLFKGRKVRTKTVLDELGHNHFDVLPHGWVKVIHHSGMPIYLHMLSRVVTFSKPYYLGPCNTRTHDVPVTAIPCLHYKRALKAEKKAQAEAEAKRKANLNNSEPCLLSAQIETAEENQALQTLKHLDLREYCQSVFNFKTFNTVRFTSWVERRKYNKEKKKKRQISRAMLPGGTKLIKFPLQNDGGEGTNIKPRGEWIMNPNGRSYICILHEYVQNALKKQPSYVFKELEIPSTPYSATVSINGMQYAVGLGASKKQAKLEAAKKTLEILIPEMRSKIEEEREKSGSKGEKFNLTIFDEIQIEDHRVAEFCSKTTESSPYTILLTCLQRNFGLGDVNVSYKVNPTHRQRNAYTMTVGKHSATVVCKNKRDGKQRASQALLQKLHPHINTWGSLLRLYGNRSMRNMKEKKQQEQEITLLQSKASVNKPNFAILDKLREDMAKLKEKRNLLKPIGKFIPPDDVGLPTASASDLDKVDL